jgi:uncharacterized protein YdeI (BOF family)
VKKMKRMLIIMVALLAMVAFASSVIAQAPAKTEKPAAAPAPGPAAEKPKMEKPKAEKPKTMRGTVAAYEAGKMIKIKGAKEEYTFDVTGDTKISGEVKEGAKATVAYKKDGDKMIATSITVPKPKPPKEKPPKKEAPKPEEKKG